MLMLLMAYGLLAKSQFAFAPGTRLLFFYTNSNLEGSKMSPEERPGFKSKSCSNFAFPTDIVKKMKNLPD